MISLATREYIHYGAEGENYRRPERVLKIKMPWRRRMFSERNDQYRLFHPTFAIYWHSPREGCMKVRWGWLASD